MLLLSMEILQESLKTLSDHWRTGGILPRRTLFGGRHAHGGIEVPIYEELRAIASRPWKDLVIIDDYRLFGTAGTSGSKDSPVYPLMSFDWSDITLAHCLKIFSDNGKLTEHFIFDDRIYVLQSGAGLEIEFLADLGIGEPHPNLSTLPPSATISLSLTESRKSTAYVSIRLTEMGSRLRPSRRDHLG